MPELKNHRIAGPDEVTCRYCRYGVQKVRNALLGTGRTFGWTCTKSSQDLVTTENMTCDASSPTTPHEVWRSTAKAKISCKK